MIGVDSSEPNTPPLEMVKVPPFISSILSVPSFARLPKSAMVFSTWAKDSLSASRITGTTNPCGADTATDMRSEEHTSELQSLMRISYAVFCLKKKKNNNNNPLHSDPPYHHHNTSILSKSHK